MAVDALIGFAKGAATAAGPKAASLTSAGAAPLDVKGFGETLGQLISGVEQSTVDANTAVSSMVDKSGEVHDAMIALQRAEMALELTVQVRNKLVQAYQEVMRMSV